MAHNSTIPKDDVRVTLDLQESLRKFENKVDANYRVFFSDKITGAQKKRSLFHLWMGRKKKKA